MSDDYPPDYLGAGVVDLWEASAKQNVDTWGRQEMDTLLLAMQEELGELTQAYLEWKHETADPKPIAEELNDLAPLLLQFRWELEDYYVPESVIDTSGGDTGDGE